MAGNFSEVPILDYSLIAAGKKEDFIRQLQHAVINVGFLYLSNPPVERRLIDSLIDYIPKLFDLPQERKDAIAMRNSQHFMGYTRLGSELTKGNVDQREQFDFATEYRNKWKPGDPEYLRLWGDSQVGSTPLILRGLQLPSNTDILIFSGLMRSCYLDLKIPSNNIWTKLKLLAMNLPGY